MRRAAPGPRRRARATTSRRGLGAGLALGALAAASAWAPAARAVEREHQIGPELGVPLLVVQRGGSNTRSGVSVGAHYTSGLNDALNLVADAGTSLLPFGGGSFATATNVNLGMAYVLDVLRWVPWGAAEAGGYTMTGSSLGGTRVLPGFALALGVDYRFDRSWALGITVRQLTLFTDPSEFPRYTQGLGRRGYPWGWCARESARVMRAAPPAALSPRGRSRRAARAPRARCTSPPPGTRP